mgnify:FL=1
MPVGSIEKTTCYGKRLRTIRSLFRIRKMPADRGLRGYRGRPGRAGLPQARGPQALKLRGNRGFASQRPAGLGRTETPLRRPAVMSFPGAKKAPQYKSAGLLHGCETHGLRSISSMPFRVPAPRSIVRQKSRSSSRTVPFRRRSRIVFINCSANAGASISGSRSCSWRQVSR